MSAYLETIWVNLFGKRKVYTRGIDEQGLIDLKTDHLMFSLISPGVNHRITSEGLRVKKSSRLRGRQGKRET